MMIKKYVVDDVREALIRGKYELGKDAFILSTKTIKVGKWFNPFKKEQYEVLVGMKREEEKPAEKPVKEKEVEPTRELVKEVVSELQAKPTDLENNIEELKKHMDIDQKSGKNIGIDRKILNATLEANPFFENAEGYIVNQLLPFSKFLLKEGEALSVKEKADFLKYAYRGNCFENKVESKKINVFVGPTGVGKTTAIAKIASIKVIDEGKSVALITLDTHKIGAIDQLKSYSEILDIPFGVVNNQEDLQRKIKEFQDCDVILIDTLGTSQNNREQLEIINNYISVIEDKNVFLTFSISTNEDVMDAILKEYRLFRYDGMVLTKFDELVNLKNLWHIIQVAGKPAQYFSYGQTVPDNFKTATLENIISYGEYVIESNVNIKNITNIR